MTLKHQKLIKEIWHTYVLDQEVEKTHILTQQSSQHRAF